MIRESLFGMKINSLTWLKIPKLLVRNINEHLILLSENKLTHRKSFQLLNRLFNEIFMEIFILKLRSQLNSKRSLIKQSAENRIIIILGYLKLSSCFALNNQKDVNTN